jgi:hypothetical protein
MKLALLVYRIIYGVSLAAILAAVAQEIRLGEAGGVSVILLTCLFACALAAAICATFAFRRFAVSLLWLLSLLLVALFTWYGWFSPSAPFVLHEVHTFDPAAAAAEAGHYRIQALVVYAILLLWFISLPVVRRLSRNSAYLTPQ